jgi:CDP-diacylglycerol--serine O-phosphatidyltransferase
MSAETRDALPQPTRPARFRRGAAILPSLFTTGNLFLGFWAVIKTLNGQYDDAAPLILGAIVLDMLDGRIARMTGTTSEFGAELDSLADVISFGVAPALLAYRWGFEGVPRAGWLAAFFFLVCGALRLARFNVQKHAVDGRYFVGLPIPAAAGQVAAVVWVLPEPLEGHWLSVATSIAVVALGFLMVSTLRYPSFKNVDLRRRRSYINVLGIALLFLLIALHPALMLLGLATAYALWAPTVHLFNVLRRKGEPPSSPSAAAS